jgi:hypothetical protein
MSLPDLPPELIERINILLPLDGICSLRLTNRTLASKATQEHFKAHFRMKRLRLTEKHLQSFVEISVSRGLGNLLQDLTLVSPVYDFEELTLRLQTGSRDVTELNESSSTSLVPKLLGEDNSQQAKLDLEVLRQRIDAQLEFVRSERDIELLSQAFSNLAANRVSIHILQTEVEIHEDDATAPLRPLFAGRWSSISAAAENCTRTLFASLAVSGLSIQSLDLFNSHRMLRCSLPCNVLESVDYTSDKLVSMLDQLVNFSMRISGCLRIKSSTRKEASGLPHDLGQEEDYDSSSDEKSLQIANKMSSFDSLRSLLQNCSSLQTLDLAGFRLSHEDTQAAQVQSRSIIQAVEGADLLCLQKLTLQGLTITEYQLLNMLQDLKTLWSLSLRFICLSEGSFKRVLDYCTIEVAMKEVELESLYESRLIHFESPWATEWTTPWGQTTGKKGLKASYKRTLDEAASHQIKYRLATGRTPNSPGLQAWARDLRDRFGPSGERPELLRQHVRSEASRSYK